MKFRKKPIVVEAFHMTNEHIMDDSLWPEWLKKAILFEQVPISFGGWIIRGGNGKLYTCTNDVFESTYEAVETTSTETPVTVSNPGAYFVKFTGLNKPICANPGVKFAQDIPSAPSDAQVWLSMWHTAVASGNPMKQSYATNLADAGLADYKERFGKKVTE